MGYTFTWDDIEKICLKLGMKRQGKTAVWKGVGADGVKRTCIIHAKHKGNVGSGVIPGTPTLISELESPVIFRDSLLNVKALFVWF